MCAVAGTIYFTLSVMAKPIIRGRIGEFTSNLLEITNMHAPAAFLDGERTQHISTRVPADQNLTNH